MHLVQTLDLYGMPENWDRIAGFYLEALADVPADLIPATMKNVRMTCKWFPKPSELRACVPDEARERRLALARMRVALANAKPEPVVIRQPLTAEQQAKLDEIKATLGTGTPRKRDRSAAPSGPIGAIVTAPLLGDDDPRAQEWLRRMGG